jgi:hypothetical protein
VAESSALPAVRRRSRRCAASRASAVNRLFMDPSLPTPGQAWLCPS